MNYRDKLRDRRWQMKRLQVFNRAKWECESCKSSDNHIPLHVHHKVYRRIDPWEYRLEDLESLCERCHTKEHEYLKGNGKFKEGECYTLNVIFATLCIPQNDNTLGTFLPMVKGHIVCGLFHKQWNPDAPDIVLPGDDSKITEPTERFCQQSFPVPIFLKVPTGGAKWKFVGDHKVEIWTENKKEIEIHRKHANRQKVPISRILFLRRG